MLFTAVWMVFTRLAVYRRRTRPTTYYKAEHLLPVHSDQFGSVSYLFVWTFPACHPLLSCAPPHAMFCTFYLPATRALLYAACGNTFRFTPPLPVAFT